MTTHKLTIATDLNQTHWLEYLLDEFRRIQGFDHTIEVIKFIDLDTKKYPHVLFYCRRYQSDPTIINLSEKLCSPSIHQLEVELYVLEQTLTTDQRFACSYDLFWNAFVFLSRLEEFEHFKHHQNNTLSHCMLHPRSDRSSLTIPIVNVLFNKLEKIINKHFPELNFRPSPKPIIELSHDLDYVHKSLPFIIKQSILNCYDMLHTFPQLVTMTKIIKKSFEFLFSRPSYWCFDYWESLEKSYQQKSIYYVYAKTGGNSPINWAINPNYNLSKHDRLQHQLLKLIADGFEIGLHGSFHSAVHREVMEREKNLLEKIIKRPVRKTRQHWLRFIEDKTPYIHDEFFDYDSTLGFNDRVGFRNGCASMFHPYDHINQRSFKYWEIPEIIMDFNVYQSLGLENVDFINRSIQVIERTLKCKSAHAAISWHPHVCTPDYSWHKHYEHLLKFVTDYQKVNS